ncbi:hypothetical protein GCM10028832_08480 [Streptomyces sparsus]
MDLGGVQAQLDAFGLGVGEHVRQRAQPQAGAVGDRAPPLGQERSYLCDRAGDGGAVDAEQQAEHCVRQVVAQMDQRGHRPVDEHQLVTGAGTGSPLADSSPRSMTAALKAGLPRHRQLLDQASEMTPRDPREQPMRQYRPIDHDRHSPIMPPARHDASPAITHQLVSLDLS